MKELGKKIAGLRKHKGYSQEQLANEAGIDLRTVQRIESGQTNPRGYTLQQLAETLGVRPDEILDWSEKEDRGFLQVLNLSCLSLIILPVIGIIITLILWISKKEKVKGANQLGRKILNFQITWSSALFLISMVFIPFLMAKGFSEVDGTLADRSMVADIIKTNMATLLLIHLVFNFWLAVMVIYNGLRIRSAKEVFYTPAVQVLK